MGLQEARTKKDTRGSADRGCPRAGRVKIGIRVSGLGGSQEPKDHCIYPKMRGEFYFFKKGICQEEAEALRARMGWDEIFTPLWEGSHSPSTWEQVFSESVAVAMG